ncbi:MAG: hypothetical protein HN348_01445 [Proteobacteria bacterium]|nr:hypothetical protein [Pseudomonadota bacterium]
MKRRLVGVIVLGGLAGAVAATTLQVAWATDCGCWGDEWELALETDSLDTCLNHEEDCTGKWLEEASLSKNESGLHLHVYGASSYTLEVSQ